ncbi:MAG: ABC transporter ATP-binding protein, partial [Mycoplasma sp.]|nr:ABC transporter ATP-binding protein [Mycoplasma sp.]
MNLNQSEYGIEIKNYLKIFKKRKVIDNIDIKVTRGSIHGFIGPNGAGKTTTIKALIGGFIPNKGEFLINGLKAGSLEAKKMIGYIPENARFPHKMKAIKYLQMMAELSGLTSKEASILAEEKLKEIGLWDQKNMDPNRFSSGMKKKLLFAQALINKPNVLILDEPAANLDPTARYDLFSQMKKWARQENATIFISSHILQELQDIVDEITILDKGRVVFTGKIKEFIQEDEYIIHLDNFELQTQIIETLKNLNFDCA